jgi:hypothetical protein
MQQTGVFSPGGRPPPHDFGNGMKGETEFEVASLLCAVPIACARWIERPFANGRTPTRARMVNNAEMWRDMTQFLLW